MTLAPSFCLLLVLSAAPAQPEPTGRIELDKTALKALRDQSRAMANAAVSKNWAVFVKAMYPKVVVMLGGEEKARATTAKIAADSESLGTKTKSTDVADPRFCVRVESGDLQCVLQQTTHVLHEGKPFKLVADLVALSSDRGAHWTFLSASGNDLESLRAALPELSPDLPIVPQGEPIPESPVKAQGGK